MATASVWRIAAHFRHYIKWLSKCCGELAGAPDRVGKYDIQKAAFVRGRAVGEKTLRFLGDSQERDALIHVGLFCILMPADFAEATGFVLAPFSGHPVIADFIDPTVEFVDMHDAQAFCIAVMLSLKPLHCLMMLFASSV